MIATLEEAGTANSAGAVPVVASLEGVNKNYGQVQALKGVNFRVRAGEVVIADLLFVSAGRIALEVRDRLGDLVLFAAERRCRDRRPARARAQRRERGEGAAHQCVSGDGHTLHQSVRQQAAAPRS